MATNGAVHGDAPFRVAFSVNGTRGDFQPYLSLAVVLRKAGHSSMFFTSIGHVKMATSFGLEGVVTCGDMEDVLRSPGCKEAMEQGDFALIAKSLDLMNGTVDGLTPEETLERANEAFEKFNPDLIVFNHIGCMGLITIGKKLGHIPKINVELQPQARPSNYYKASAMQRELPDPDTPNIMTFFWSLDIGASVEPFAKAFAEKASKEEILRLMDGEMTPEEHWEENFEPEKRLLPVFLAYSKSFWPSPDDWPVTDKVQIVGNFKLSKEVQNDCIAEGNTFFSVGSDFDLCRKFIAKGGPPVYIGWGSMVVYSTQHMTELAVRALKQAGERGIVLGGWARIGLDGLDESKDREELVAWCEENVLFVKAAPHELLFPLCKCAVHHGGIGTTQASLSGSCPTLITPVFADQFDNAKHLTTTGCGFATTRLGKLKFGELGDAIKTICGEPQYKEKTVALAERMLKEDGVGYLKTWIETFVNEELRTGKYKARRQEHQERLYELRAKSAKLNGERIVAKYSSKLNEMYPAVKEFNMKNIAFLGLAADLVGKGKVWSVSGTAVLAREGQDLQSPQAGRYRKFCFLEELEQKGSRVHVRKMRGRGPAEGWVTPTVSGKAVMFKLDSVAQIGMVQAEEYQALFSDVFESMASAKKA